jgi:hypothetical protein
LLEIHREVSYIEVKRLMSAQSSNPCGYAQTNVHQISRQGDLSFNQSSKASMESLRICLYPAFTTLQRHLKLSMISLPAEFENPELDFSSQ